jgi:hypothetical protein
MCGISFVEATGNDGSGRRTGKGHGDIAEFLADILFKAFHEGERPNTESTATVYTDS